MKRPVAVSAVIVILIFTISVLSCLDPVGYPESNTQDNTNQSSGDQTILITIDGIQPQSGKQPTDRINTIVQGVGADIEWSDHTGASVPITLTTTFEEFEDYTALIYLYAKGGHSLPLANAKIEVKGALDFSYNPATAIITARFPRTHRPVNSVTDLNAAIGALALLPPILPPIDYTVNRNIIELTDNFYNAANSSGSFITIGAGDADNAVPYTIRGLGKFTNKELNVGILLANNNITLEGVNINITTTTKGVPHVWSTNSKTDPSKYSYYRAAVLIGRYKAAPDTAHKPDDYYAADASANILSSKNVSVQNCNISFAVSDSMIAGVYIRPGTSANPIENISIANNEISVEATGNSGYAAQALLVHRYAPTLSITGNGLKSKNTPQTHVNPAGGLFMQLDPDIPSNVTPLISGNTINGKPTYDFFINILSKGDRTGVPQMIADKFATPDSTWMTEKSTDTGTNRSFYKKLIETLLPQTRTGLGYGYLALYFGGTPAAPENTDCVFEVYYRQSNRLYAIDFWGYTITAGTPAVYTSSPECRARLLLDEQGVVYKKDEFHWSPDITGTNIP